VAAERRSSSQKHTVITSLAVAKKRHAAKHAHSPHRKPPAAPPGPVPPPLFSRVLEWIAIALLFLVVLGTSLAVDPKAYASFDAPKRLIGACGTALAGFVAFGVAYRSRTGMLRWRAIPLAARVALVAASAALAWATLSAFLSPDRAVARDSLRAILLFSLLLPLGASAVVARRRNLLVGGLLAAAAGNAVLSLLQTRGISPFRLQTFGARNETGALAGNVGYLALALTFAAVLALGILLATRSTAIRVAAAAALLLSLAGIFVNRNLTAIAALAIGGVVLLAAWFGRRSRWPVIAIVAALAAGAVLVPPLRQRVGQAVGMVRRGEWDRLTTYRTGAWAAAVQMVRDRPLVGFGPGTYAAEFTPHRLVAEIRNRRRYVNPLLTSSYSEAHCDYLQAFAETGVPGGIAVLAAVAALVAAVGRRTAKADPHRIEAAILLGLLAAGAAAALTWFPMQRPISAAPLLLAAGRSWRLAAGLPDDSESR
jgi:O-antigen ligase